VDPVAAHWRRWLLWGNLAIALAVAAYFATRWLVRRRAR
jgi:hypothetical protein